MNPLAMALGNTTQNIRPVTPARCSEMRRQLAHRLADQLDNLRLKIAAGARFSPGTARHVCATCGYRAPSRSALFRHLRAAMHGVLTRVPALVRLVLAGDWAAVSKAAAVATTGELDQAVETGETALWCAMAIVASTAAVETREAALAAARELVALGANPQIAPVQQRDLGYEAISRSGRKKGPKTVGDHLSLWRASAGYRGSALEIAWAVRDPELVELLVGAVDQLPCAGGCGVRGAGDRCLCRAQEAEVYGSVYCT